MSSEQISHMVAASVIPMVVISAASLLCLAFYNRLAAVVTRLRAVQRERLELQDRMERLTAAEIEKSSTLRFTCILESLAEQSIVIIRRARLIRLTLFFLLICIAWLVACSLFSGVSVVISAAVAVAVLCFVCGMVSLLAAVICALLELQACLNPAELEIGVVSELTGFPTAVYLASGELRIA